MIGHHAHVGRDGGELLGVHRVILARVDEHHRIADARRVEGKRGHRGYFRPEIEKHRASAGAGQLILGAAGLAEVALLGGHARQSQGHGIKGNEAAFSPFRGDLARCRFRRARERAGAEQRLQNGAHHHLEGRRGGQTAAGGHLRAGGQIEAAQRAARLVVGGQHAAQKGAGGLGLHAVGPPPIRIVQVDRIGAEALHGHPHQMLSVFGRKPPDALADGRGNDAAALVVHVVARHLQPARRRGEHEGAMGRHGCERGDRIDVSAGTVVGVPVDVPADTLIGRPHGERLGEPFPQMRQLALGIGVTSQRYRTHRRPPSACSPAGRR